MPGTGHFSHYNQFKSILYVCFSLSGLNHLSFDPASTESLGLGSAAGPQVSNSPAENGSDPGKRKRSGIPPGELMPSPLPAEHEESM